MDWQWIATALIGFVCALLSIMSGMMAYVVKGLHESVAELRRENKEGMNSQKELTEKVHKIESLVLGDYVKNSDFKDFSNVMFGKIDSMRAEVKQDLAVMRSEINSKQDKG